MAVVALTAVVAAVALAVVTAVVAAVVAEMVVMASGNIRAVMSLAVAEVAGCHRTSTVPNRPVNFPTLPISAHPDSCRHMST